MKRAVLVIVFVCLPAAALAIEPACPDAISARVDPRGTGPLPAGDGPADFGQVPEACPGLDVLARLRSTLLVASDYPDYYGNVMASTMVRLRYPLTARTWMSVGLDVVTFRYVANAVVRSHAFDVGPPTVGVFRDVGHVGPGALALYARLLLPLDTARTNGVLLGGEAGVSYWRPLRSRFAVQVGVAAPVPVTVIDGQAHGAFRPAGVVEASWRAGRVAALIIGATGHLEATPDPGLLSLAARAGLRLALARGINAALIGEIPFAGSDRTNAIASLFVGWTPARP
ncbi:MAG TPA: hypothetical protein VGL59_00460 [Polyangia bacterium]|jgi:hypothetical protein